MQREFIPINESGMEIVEYVSETFPCAIFNADIGKYNLGYVPWHWHEEVEIYVVLKGKLKVYLSGHSYILEENQAAFINSNVLHAMDIAEGDACHLITILFSPSIFTGGKDTAFYKKVTESIIGNENIQSHVFLRDNVMGSDFIQAIKEIYKVYSTNQMNMELMIGENLSKIWRYLISEINEVNRDPINKIQEVRTQTMMKFIHDHYNHPLSLKDIAASVSISTRECSRCFQNIIHTSAIKYLMSHRIAMSLNLLVENKYSITQIASKVGFNSSSYFTKVFLEIMDMSPSDYKKRYN